MKHLATHQMALQHVKLCSGVASESGPTWGLHPATKPEGIPSAVWDPTRGWRKLHKAFTFYSMRLSIIYSFLTSGY